MKTKTPKYLAEAVERSDEAAAQARTAKTPAQKAAAAKALDAALRGYEAACLRHRASGRALPKWARSEASE